MDEFSKKRRMKPRSPRPGLGLGPRLLYLTIFALCAPAARGIDGPIKTIVVLVMENRSFDHMLGWMKRLNPEIEGVTGRESNPVSTKDPNSSRVYFTDDAEFVDPDPGHTFEAVREQVFGSNLTAANPAPMNGFVQQALTISKNLSETVMRGLKPEAIPVYAELIKEFAVFDRWFSSLPGPTHPNRLFVYSGTSHGATSHIAKQLAVGYPQKTIFESLHEAGLSFGIYYQNIPATLFYRNLRKLKYVPKFHHYGLKFRRHARKGKLPNLTVIEPRYFDLKLFPANDDHPAHDLANGQRLVKQVYETLRASPQWNETLFLVTYDEHGGFYDHVPTPVKGVPSPDGVVGPSPYFFKFDRLGVRVPTIMISPWIKKATLVHRPSGPTSTSEFEHSSVPATIKKMFNLSSNFLTYRDAWAGTFESVLNVHGSPRTDCPVVLPEVKTLRSSPANETGKLSEFQKEMVQLAAVINGDHILKSYPDDIGNRMNVGEANAYVEDAMSRFMEASMEAIKMGAPESTIVEMRPSLTSRNP
uniref:TSA: Wollemia nobilis Ref_Wollemi_Transcript_10289_1948 transcribed RNA sequence n=1 Tax=Wollemia nobilis TaxID=56998 RepID=A0A0C9QTN8_9CONI